MASAQTEVHEVKQKIQQKLIESGEYARLRESLSARLAESGWKEEIKRLCQEAIRTRGTENVSIEELVEEVAPRAKAIVPPKVRRRTLEAVQRFLVENSSSFSVSTPSSANGSDGSSSNGKDLERTSNNDTGDSGKDKNGHDKANVRSQDGGGNSAGS